MILFHEYKSEQSNEILHINPFTPKSAKFKTKGKVLNFILKKRKKQTAPLESTAQ